VRKPSWFQRVAAILVIAGVYAAAGPIAGAAAQEPKLPVVFVHGGSGSASQYEVQAQRWASNAYPYEVRAIDRATGVNFNTAFDEFVDDVLA
jgi:pimeloyl-ACP methyl ester carboxylesterase